MNLQTFLNHCGKLPNRQYKPDADQEAVISHGEDPLWVVAGPGSGKTDSIVLRCLKLMIVDNINPKSIIITTFTEKAARNLEDRIGVYMQYFASVDPMLKKVDYTRLRTGTIHSLGNDIMQEFRYSGYQNYRLLEDLEESLFILEHSSFCLSGKRFSADKFRPIWDHPVFQPQFTRFSYITNRPWSSTSNYPPNRWLRSDFARKAFDTIVNEDLDPDDLISQNEEGIKLIGELYKEYRDKLESTYRVDFSHLQQKFLRFLNSPESRQFLQGDGTELFPGIKHVLVDEYQDTNTIQEKIYFKLAELNGNLCVVGDDDQALYRFRGGRVELMLRFPEICNKTWPQLKTKTVFLHTNYRSHNSIVTACDGYIKSFNSKSGAQNRVKGKPDLVPGSGIGGKYSAAAIHVENGTGGRNSGLQELAAYFASITKGLKDNNIIGDYSEVALLMPSTRNNASAPKAFMEALDNLNVPYYNPRGVPVIEAEEVETLLGAFLHIIDHDGDKFLGTMEGVTENIRRWRETYSRNSEHYGDLAKYVNTVSENIDRKDAGVNIGANMLQLAYYLLGFEPFPTWLKDPVKAIHIGLVTQVFDAFSNVPSSYDLNRILGSIYTTGREARGGVSFRWMNSFYFSLISLLTDAGMSEQEDEEISYPMGMVPIMTIHQSKGLEFPFVFVHGISSWKPSTNDIIFERTLRSAGNRKVTELSIDEMNEMAKQDVARMFYVAYSRAQYALTILVQKYDRTNPGIGCGGVGWSVFRHMDRVGE